MVISRSGTSGQADLLAATRTRPSSTSSPSPSSSSVVKRAMTQSSLHDFSFPVLKTWGSQRILRCVKVPDNGDDGTASGWKSMASGGGETMMAGDDGFEKVRAKLMVHLREASDKIDLAVTPRGGAEQGEVAASVAPAAAVEEDTETEAPAAMPPAATETRWSMRTRRATYNRPMDVLQRQSSSSPNPSPSEPPRSLRPRSGGQEKEEDGMRRRKFSVELSREEIDEDIFALTGRRASRRPKKRPKPIRKQLDLLFPGFYLTEVTAECYDVPEPPPVES